MEVAAGKNDVIVGKYQRVIGDAISLHFQQSGAITNLLKTGTHHLGLAAQGVGVLHFVTIGVGLFDVAVIKYLAISGGHVNLSGQSSCLVDAGVKRAAAAHGRFNREAAADNGRGKQVFSTKQSLQGKGGAGLGAVQ